jgi:aryl-alcohol dehydrogenase (NADP+)
MERRALGRTGRTVSAIGLGTVTFGREIDEATSFRVMDYAFERGITFFDTAELYGGGASERIVGRWIRDRGCRDEITLCTKVGTGAGAANIPKAVGDSLARLELDSVDILKIHNPDPEAQAGETLSAMTSEIEAGRVRIIGCSNYSAALLREALEASVTGGYRRFDVLQPPYSLVARGGEDELFPLCVREEIAITAYSPLGAGFLTGKYTPDREAIPQDTRFGAMPGHADIYFSERNFRIVDALRSKAEELDVPMVRLAMAYAMANSDITSVLVGARTTGHIDNALEALDMGLDEGLRSEMSSWPE